MTQIYNMNTDDIRGLAYEYMRQGIPSRAIQCFERLLWLGSLRRREYLRLAALYPQRHNVAIKRIIERYKAIYK